MRTLRASSDPAATEAIALFVYRIVREIGSMAAALAAWTRSSSLAVSASTTLQSGPRSLTVRDGPGPSLYPER